MHVSVLTAAQVSEAIPRFANILIDAVADGAGVSFMYPLAEPDAEQFWREELPSVNAERTFILACKDERRNIMGLVMLQRAWAPNQPHRADVTKLLVHRDFRRQGVASALIQKLEKHAQSIGLTLLTFDAVAGGGTEKFYRTMGYQPVGIVPGYAYSGTGRLDDTMFFYKQL